MPDDAPGSVRRQRADCVEWARVADDVAGHEVARLGDRGQQLGESLGEEVTVPLLLGVAGRMRTRPSAARCHSHRLGADAGESRPGAVRRPRRRRAVRRPGSAAQLGQHRAGAPGGHVTSAPPSAATAADQPRPGGHRRPREPERQRGRGPARDHTERRPSAARAAAYAIGGQHGPGRRRARAACVGHDRRRAHGPTHPDREPHLVLVRKPDLPATSAISASAARRAPASRRCERRRCPPAAARRARTPDGCVPRRRRRRRTRRPRSSRGAWPRCAASRCRPSGDPRPRSRRSS